MSLLHLFRASVRRIWDYIVTSVILYEGKLKAVSIRFLCEWRQVFYCTRSHQTCSGTCSVRGGSLFLKIFLDFDT